MAYKGKRVIKPTRAQQITGIIGLVLCVILSLMLIFNLSIIVKGSINPDEPPAVLGITPLVVLSGSMSGDAPDHIEPGDMIFVDKVDAKDLNVGDVIAFKWGKIIVTHRIVEISTDKSGARSFTTEGDANNTPDESPVPEDDVVGIYRFRIGKVGNFALFMQTPLGMFLFIGLPLMAFIGYDIIRRQRYANQESERTAELEAEIARLRALTAEKSDADI